MPQQPVASVQNKFTKGLITEFSGLNFPEDAATDCDNTTFSIVGNVTRRFGIDKEENGGLFSLAVTGQAKSSYVWKNAGGDGNTQVEVVQSGNILTFFSISTATATTPLSKHKLTSFVSLNPFITSGFDATLECTYADGNGYLFVFHPNCDPFYCTYNAGTITGNRITVQIRDFIGVPEAGVSPNIRPTALTAEHNYNLLNQGWIAGNPWSTLSASVVTVGLGAKTFTVSAGLTVTLGDQVTIIVNHATTSGLLQGPIMSGNVTAYAGTTMTINVTSGATGYFGITGDDWVIVPRNTAYIQTWFSAIGNYPSNSDVWWYFKDNTGAFAPATTLANVSLGAGNGPRGHFILDAFSQQRDVLSSLAITDIQTNIRPSIGAWFQGRVFYSGVNAQQAATGDVDSYSWTENIYFSQVVQQVSDLGHCYQTNDPTSENLFDLLPTDGGVISLIGSGSIFKLFTYQNGLLVFTANGIKFITGSQGIGFTANDYTVTDISSVRSISSTSFVNVNGIPYFWNEDGIYSVQPSKNGGMTVDPITVTTILSFFGEIPLSSKKYARGAYHPIDYIIQWIYKDEESTGIADRYSFNKILNYNTYNQAFFPYTIPNTPTSINTIDYVSGPGGLNTPEPAFKYVCTNGSNSSFADEHDSTYVDWASFSPVDFNSYFLTGYQIRGQAQKMFFPGYVWVFSTSSDSTNTAYKFNSIWDYATSGNSGRWSSERLVEIPPVNFGIYYRRHKLRGHGLALQFKVQSVSGKNFDIIGWTSSDNVNTGI